MHDLLVAMQDEEDNLHSLRLRHIGAWVADLNFKEGDLFQFNLSDGLFFMKVEEVRRICVTPGSDNAPLTEIYCGVEDDVTVGQLRDLMHLGFKVDSADSEGNDELRRSTQPHDVQPS
jgi:hypothetical protein